jgi:uncharacterized protein
MHCPILQVLQVGETLRAKMAIPGTNPCQTPRKSIAHDTHIPVQSPSATEFTLAHNVSRKEEVDMVMEQAKKAGAKIIKSAQDTFYGGYAGYFQDPDTHVWEIAWNPQLFPE